MAHLHDNTRCCTSTGRRSRSLPRRTRRGVRGIVTGGHIGWPAPRADKTPDIELVAINGVGYDGRSEPGPRPWFPRVTNTPDRDGGRRRRPRHRPHHRFPPPHPAGRTLCPRRELAAWRHAARPQGDACASASSAWAGSAAPSPTGSAARRQDRYNSRTPKDLPYAYVDSLTELARQSDVLILAAAATAERCTS